MNKIHRFVIKSMQFFFLSPYFFSFTTITHTQTETIIILTFIL